MPPIRRISEIPGQAMQIFQRHGFGHLKVKVVGNHKITAGAKQIDMPLVSIEPDVYLGSIQEGIVFNKALEEIIHTLGVCFYNFIAGGPGAAVFGARPK